MNLIQHAAIVERKALEDAAGDVAVLAGDWLIRLAAELLDLFRHVLGSSKARVRGIDETFERRRGNGHVHEQIFFDGTFLAGPEIMAGIKHLEAGNTFRKADGTVIAQLVIKSLLIAALVDEREGQV